MRTGYGRRVAVRAGTGGPRVRYRAPSVSSVPVSASCSRPGCQRAPSATLTYDYAARVATVDHLAPAHPMQYDLCDSTPSGCRSPTVWTLVDQRVARTRRSTSATAEPPEGIGRFPRVTASPPSTSRDADPTGPAPTTRPPPRWGAVDVLVAFVVAQVASLIGFSLFAAVRGCPPAS